MIHNLGIAPAWGIAFVVLGIIVSIAILALIGGRIHLEVARWRHDDTFKRDLAVWQAEKDAFLQEHGNLHNFYSHQPQSYYRPNYGDFEPWWAVSIIAGAIAVVIGIVQAIWTIPYDAKYLSWYEVSGKVQSVQSGVLIDGKFTTENFIVTIEGNPIPYQMDDARILTQQDKDVVLLCGVSWQSFGNAADSWSCSIKSADYTE